MIVDVIKCVVPLSRQQLVSGVVNRMELEGNKNIISKQK